MGDAFGLGVGAFDAVDDRLELEIAFERLFGLRLDIAHGGSDLFVRVGGDVLHQEIHQAGVALQQRENLHSAIGGSGLRFGRGSGLHGHGLGVAEGEGDVGGERS